MCFGAASSLQRIVIITFVVVIQNMRTWSPSSIPKARFSSQSDGSPSLLALGVVRNRQELRGDKESERELE